MNRAQMMEAAGLVLKNPLDPAFKIRWMAQFTTEYLQEFVHILRDEVHESHAEWHRLSTAPRVKKGEVEKALKHKRMMVGRLTAVVLELGRRGESVPRLRAVK